MNITLYAAAQELRAVLDQIDPETGELPEGFESVRGLVANKSGKVAAWIAQTEAEAEFVEQHARSLLDRVKAARKRSAWLRAYLGANMRATGISEIKSDQMVIRWYPERDKSVDVFQPELVPAEFREDPKPPEPSKSKIRAAIDAGIDVPGARVVGKDRVTIK